MRGVIRPCRRRLGPELHSRWLSHLCGLCLGLRDTAGQSARVLTGYDVLLVSVLTEAQAGRLPTTTAGPCPLRGFRTAEVVDAATPGAQAAVAAALVVGEASLTDKVDDGDVPVWLRPLASGTARRLARLGASAAEACGWDGTDMSAAPARAKRVEGRDGARLDELLEPSGAAVAALFAHTATTSGMSGNESALRRLGDAFGRLVHLIDAAEDRRSDRRHGRFNPLEATGTSDVEAERLARYLHAEVGRSLSDLTLVDGALAEALFGPALGAAIGRVWAGHPEQVSPAPRRRFAVSAAVAAAMAGQAAMWVGGRGRGPYGYGPYGYGPYGGRPYPYYGRGRYGRRGGCGGPSCGEMLACDCCANCACDQCCGGDTCCCCI